VPSQGGREHGADDVGGSIGKRLSGQEKGQRKKGLMTTSQPPVGRSPKAFGSGLLVRKGLGESKKGEERKEGKKGKCGRKEGKFKSFPGT